MCFPLGKITEGFLLSYLLGYKLILPSSHVSLHSTDMYAVCRHVVLVQLLMICVTLSFLSLPGFILLLCEELHQALAMALCRLRGLLPTMAHSP